MAAAVKRFVASNIKKSLVPLIRPATDSPLIRLKRMTPGSPHAHLPLSSLPFFERDYYNRFPLTRRFSRVLLRWTNSTEQRRGMQWVETPECLAFYMNLSGMNPEKVEVSFRHYNDEPGVVWCSDFFISGEADLTFGYVARAYRPRIGMFKLPEKILNFNISDIKVEIGRNSGELKVTLPKLQKPDGYVKPTENFSLSFNATVIDDH